MEILETNAADREDWTRFLYQQPRSSVYATPEFIDFLSGVVPGRPRCFKLVEGGVIRGLLPAFMHEHNNFGRVLNSLPWYGSHGGCVIAEGDSEARRSLLAGYRRLLDQEEFSFAVLIPPLTEVDYSEDYDRLLQPLARDYRIGQVTQLPISGDDDELALERVLKQKTRNLVRKSRKQGFRRTLEENDESWNFLYEVHQENMAAIGGKAKPMDHFESLRQSIPAEMRELAIAWLGDVPVAALLLLRFNRTVEYFTPVVKQAYRSQQPMSFLIWHAMLDAMLNDYRWWNWGGTWPSQESLHHFKAGWGATDIPYNYFIHGSSPSLVSLRTDPDAWAEQFPYYFLYPYNELQRGKT